MGISDARKTSRADKEIVLLGVWLHDIGHLIGNSNVDHAINSEIETRKFLSRIGYEKQKIDEVAHCVRAHRCKDIQPETIEAKIVAACDSARHMTDYIYTDIAMQGNIDKAKSKLERDIRDVDSFPEL